VGKIDYFGTKKVPDLDQDTEWRWVIWSDHNLSRPVAKFLVVCGHLTNEQDTDRYELFGILSEL
jgi:hypothetical protein